MSEQDGPQLSDVQRRTWDGAVVLAAAEDLVKTERESLVVAFKAEAHDDLVSAVDAHHAALKE